MLDKILDYASRVCASDVHLAGNRIPVLRIRGRLYQQNSLPAISVEELARIIEKYNLSTKYAITVDLDNPTYLFRMVMSYCSDGINLAIRLLHRHAQTLAELNLPSELIKISEFSSGLFLIAGATGSGKSTTATCMLEMMLNRGIHLLTLENPIEHIFTSNISCITQQEYGRHFDSFADAAQHAMYQDPDVIYFGELVDHATIATALSLAETGHFVLGTIHAKGAAETVSRIIDIFEASRQNFVRGQLLSCLHGIFWQELLAGIDVQYPLYELLQMTPALSSSIAQGKSAVTLRGELQTNCGCIPRNSSAAKLMNRGVEQATIQRYLNESEMRSLLVRKK